MLVKRYMTLYIVPALAHLSRARTDFSLQFACFYEAPSLQHARIHVPPPIGRHRVARCVAKFLVFLSSCCYYLAMLLSCGKMDKFRLAIWLWVIYVWMRGECDRRNSRRQKFRIQTRYISFSAILFLRWSWIVGCWNQSSNSTQRYNLHFYPLIILPRI